jgi:transglutaminase-like putative cysteine protease
MILLNKLQSPNVQPAALILLLGLFLVLIPHFSHLPLWLSIVSSGLVLWRACYELQLCKIPGKLILFLLTIMLLVGIVFSYHTLIGRNAGSAMLLGLLCLKLFEIKSYRDVSIIINLALFSIVINFLFNQSIPVAFTMLLALIFLFTALISFQHDYKKLNKIQPVSIDVIRSSEKQHFKLAFKMLTQAIPFAIVLFILFPRVNSPLWGLPEDAFSATTGLSDQMSPGRISQLSNNTSVAFRVKFESSVPAPDKLYWRGPVMWNFDGYNWSSPSNERLTISGFTFSGLGEKYSYAITLQPHNNYWMFALDLPSTLPKQSRFSANMQLLSTSLIQKLKRYEINSYTRYILPAYKQIPLQRYLQLPVSNSNESDSLLYKSKKLISKLKDSSNPENTVNNVLNYFATQDFYYSRTPPLLYDDPVDEFLFDTKRGYCEHYASSFTVLMRLAGIPSRVITGYQGGEINPIDNYMTLRQSDAHAWSEVFLGNKGWVRVDPTAAIPPGNIENTEDAIRLNSNLKKPAGLYKSSWLSKQMKQMRFALDAVNNRWNQWVLGYDSKRQKAFFAAIGIPEITWQGLSQLLFSILAVLTGILAFIVFSNQSNKKNEIQIYYFKFLKKLKRYNLIKNDAEGADDFCQRVIVKLPQQKHTIEKITLLYQQLRYEKYNEEQLTIFKKKIKYF